ncbi:MAG: efflux transporter outer membrane subunit [Rikenellaceae bacterium]
MKQIKYIVVTTLLASMVSGCGIYSKFENPVEDAYLDSLYSYIEATNDTTNIATLSYRELFTDSYLVALIEQGLENNTDLNVARLSVDQAQASLKAARLAFFPSVSAAPQGSISSFNGTTTKTYNLSLTASWEIDVFGKLRNAKERSKSALESSIAYRQAVQTQLVATIAESYYTLLMLDEQLEISLETQANWDENLRVMDAMKTAGRINETSVLQSQASSVALSSQIVSLREEIAQLENSLCTILAKPTVHIERGTILDVVFPTELSVGVPIQLLSNRPDVRVAESNLAQAFYATAESRSALYPTITLSGSAGYTNSSGVILNPGDMLYSAVGSLLQPIFNRGAIRAQIKISEAQQEQALLQFKQAILDAGAEVNNALSQWQHAQQRLELGATQIELLEKTVTKTELLMKYGKVDYLDVLVAQLSLLQTELSYSTDKYSQTQGVINLYRALGGGGSDVSTEL